ncbi:Hypothetical_protein [Hexamita inflata]|uniref:Hypothetical_protein n=1 Tax=Hexamita inflata TaxID=28002 RepID=A0ABP1HP15_9EUKA
MKQSMFTLPELEKKPHSNNFQTPKRQNDVSAPLLHEKPIITDKYGCFPSVFNNQRKIQNGAFKQYKSQIANDNKAFYQPSVYNIKVGQKLSKFKEEISGKQKQQVDVDAVLTNITSNKFIYVVKPKENILHFNTKQFKYNENSLAQQNMLTTVNRATNKSNYALQKWSIINGKRVEDIIDDQEKI